MSVQTLGEAWKLGWRVRVRCLLVGPHHKRGHRPGVRCETTTELDMKTLVWTRGETMSLDLLADRLRCPNCGNRKIQVYFEVPGQPAKRAMHASRP
jgi:hypothetical protein